MARKTPSVMSERTAQVTKTEHFSGAWITELAAAFWYIEGSRFPPIAQFLLRGNSMRRCRRWALLTSIRDPLFFSLLSFVVFFLLVSSVFGAGLFNRRAA